MQATTFLNPVLYTTGSWVPAVSASAGTLPTFVTASGTYTRIGRFVMIEGYLNNTSGGTAGAGAQAVSISLPFAPASGELPILIPVGVFINGAVTDALWGSIAAGVASMPLFKRVVNGTHVDTVAVTLNDLNDANIRSIQVNLDILYDA